MSCLTLAYTATPSPGADAVAEPVGVSYESVLGSLAAAATCLAVVVAIAAAWIAVRQLGAAASTARLDAAVETNRRWQAVRAAQRAVKLRRKTLQAVRSALDELGLESALPLETPTAVVAPVPYVLGVLCPAAGLSQVPPNNQDEYTRSMLARSVVVGHVLNSLTAESRNDKAIRRDLRELGTAMTLWVDSLNELAEMYGEQIVDRRRLIGKIHVDLSRSVWYAEPYILWRNTTSSGRWGLRLLAFGHEAREYHWASPIQNSAVREDTEFDSLPPSADYGGLASALGWMYGIGHTGDYNLRTSERALKKILGTGFTLEARLNQLKLVEELPLSVTRLGEARLSDGTWESLGKGDPRVARAASVLGIPIEA